MLRKVLVAILGIAVLAMVLVVGAKLAAACSRVLWGDNGIAVLVGRNMDWPEDMKTDLWAFPRGIKRTGEAGANSLTWTSKYGSVAASVYNLGTADGMNEKGLVANQLWLTEADYGQRDLKRPAVALSLWLQYVLDNFATVSEAVAAMQQQNIQIVPQKLPGSDTNATVHLSLGDASGDTAVIEIVDGGKLHVFHSRAYTVMTNSPPFAEQLANLKKYQGFGGSAPLPGTTEAADRFVRAAYYLENISKPKNLQQAVASMLGVMRNVAQPFTRTNDPAHPEASHTIWRSVADATDRIYFYESTLSPNIVWVQLDQLDFSVGAPVRKLDLHKFNTLDSSLIGDVTKDFAPSPPLTFLKVGG